MSYQTWKSYTKIQPYTREEREAMAEVDRIEEMDAEQDEINLEKVALLSWTAGNGSKIQVHKSLYHGFDVMIDGKEYPGCIIVEAPAKFQAMGIVAKLGPVGLIAERKAILEA